MVNKTNNQIFGLLEEVLAFLKEYIPQDISDVLTEHEITLGTILINMDSMKTQIDEISVSVNNLKNEVKPKEVGFSKAPKKETNIKEPISEEVSLIKLHISLEKDAEGKDHYLVNGSLGTDTEKAIMILNDDFPLIEGKDDNPNQNGLWFPKSCLLSSYKLDNEVNQDFEIKSWILKKKGFI